MSARRTIAPRKRPATSKDAALQQAASPLSGGNSSTIADPVTEDGITRARQQALSEFCDSLQDKRGLDREDRDTLAREFQEALTNSPAVPDVLESLDPETWYHTIDAFVEQGLIESNEAGRLRQKVDEALRPVASGKGKLVMEFTERLERDGEAAALDWLQSQNLDRFDETVQPARDIPVATGARKRRVPQGQDVTSSKSRRLRGPPQ